MMKMKATFLAMLALLLFQSGATPSWAHGGEDWPFFCSLGEDGIDGVDAFKIVADDNTASGFALKLYSQNEVVAYIEASVQESDDHKYYQVYGKQDNYKVLRDRQLLAFVAKSDKDESKGDVQVTFSGRDPEFEMKPMSCRAY